MPDKIVNHFVLADGSTAKYSATQLAGDVPEVVDIRTGYDGTVYESAGDAVRGQVSDLKSDINYTFGDYEDIPLGSGYITTNQGVGNTVSYAKTADGTWRCCIVACNAGDRFAINGQGGNAPKCWCFVDTNDKIVSVATNAINNVVLTAPVDGRLIYNSSSAIADRYCKYAPNSRTVANNTDSVLISQKDFTNFNFYQMLNKDHAIMDGNVSIGSTITLLPIFNSSGTGNLVIPCSANDKFIVCGKMAVSTSYYRLWCFVDSSGTILTRSDSSIDDTTSSPAVITAPANANKLICNLDDYTESYVVKLSDAYVEMQSLTDANAEIVAALDKKGTAIEDGLYSSFDYSSYIHAGKAVMIESIGTTVSAPFNSGNYSYYEIACNEGDVFEIFAYNVPGVTRTWAFTDNSNTILSANDNTSYGSDAYYIKQRIVAPTGTKKLYVNVRTIDEAENYVVKLGKYTIEPPTVVNDDTQEYKIVFPRLPDSYDFIERNYTNANNDKGFNDMYQAFHSLNTEDLIEEIDMSEDYLDAVSDTIPSYITNITNGGMYMWHVVPPETDGSTYTVKSKRLKLLVFSGVHGAEKKSIWDMYYLLKDIKDNANNPAAVTIRNFVDLYVVPLECPYGVEKNSRESYGGINPNRDFWNPHWSKVPDSGDTYNQLYETRCVSWWIEQLAPDAVIDHHTSSGDNSFENGKFLAWGDSAIPSISSLIEQVVIQMSPMIRSEYPDKFSSFGWTFGHTQNVSAYMSYGMLPLFAYFKAGAISCTFEVVMGIKWDGVTIMGNSDADQTAIMTIDDCVWRNFLMTFAEKAVQLKNGHIRY